MKWYGYVSTYFGYKLSADERCEAAVIARAGCRWVWFRKCGELLYGRGCPLMLKGVVYESQQCCMEGDVL